MLSTTLSDLKGALCGGFVIPELPVYRPFCPLTRNSASDRKTARCVPVALKPRFMHQYRALFASTRFPAGREIANLGAASAPFKYQICELSTFLKTGKGAVIILRIKGRKLLAAMFQETWKAGSEVREHEGITLIEHELVAKVRPRGSQGAAISLGPEARRAWERAGSLRLTFGPRIMGTPSWTSTGAQSAFSS